MRKNMLTVAVAVAAMCASATGVAQAAVQPNLVGGHEASGKTSWMVAVTYTAPLAGVYDQRFNCGGTMVFPKVVVTAAHCHTEPPAAAQTARIGVAGPVFARDQQATAVPIAAKRFSVRVGSKDRTAGGQVAKVSRVVVHPGWHWAAGAPATEVDDIAVLILDRDLEAQPIQIAATPPMPGDAITLFGWGRTSPDGRGALPKRLQQLETTVVDPELCAASNQSAGEVCTDNPNGTDGDGPGDSGGPAVKFVDGVPKFVGVCSRGAGSPGTTPNVYTDPSYFRNWIYQVARGAAA